LTDVYNIARLAVSSAFDVLIIDDLQVGSDLWMKL